MVYRDTLPELDALLVDLQAHAPPETPCFDSPLRNAPLYRTDLPSPEHVAEWQVAMKQHAAVWRERAEAVFAVGGVRAVDVDQLLTEVQGFGWTELVGEVQPLESKLKEARAWCTKVRCWRLVVVCVCCLPFSRGRGNGATWVGNGATWVGTCIGRLLFLYRRVCTHPCFSMCVILFNCKRRFIPRNHTRHYLIPL